jgi:hypothetical protein
LDRLTYSGSRSLTATINERAAARVDAGSEESADEEVASPLLLADAVGSPYGVPSDDGGVRVRVAALLFHGVLLLVCVGWLLLHHDDTFEQPAFGVAILISSTWLVAGPMLVVAWERRVLTLSVALEEADTTSAEEQRRLHATVRKLRGWLPSFLILPSFAVLVVYLWAGAAFYRAAGIPDSWFPRSTGLFILWIGGLVGGWGLWAASVSLAVARQVGGQRGDYSPFAGVTSRSADDLARFCFPAGFIFGCGVAILLPGVGLFASKAEGLSRGVLIGVGVVLVSTTTALLAYPAWVLDRRNRVDRLEVLDRLAIEIDGLVAPLVDRDSAFTEADSVRLQTLLEVRVHLAAHTMAQASVALVERIPVAVLIPLGSTVVSWYSLSR